MKAKCPHCEKGCDKCQDGYTEVNFAPASKGHYHYMICNQCACETGGHLHTPERPLPEKPNPHAVCPRCGSHDLRFSSCEEAMSF